MWVVVKWEGLTYSESSLEEVRDLRNSGVEYEQQLRDYYRREQLMPSVGTRRVNRSLDSDMMEAEECPNLREGLQLRDYQWEGVRWMLFNWSQKRNSILADEMGLGKTIQSAMFLSILNKQHNMRGPFLVVAPLSTVVQWKREITLWTTWTQLSITAAWRIVKCCAALSLSTRPLH